MCVCVFAWKGFNGSHIFIVMKMFEDKVWHNHKFPKNFRDQKKGYTHRSELPVML